MNEQQPSRDPFRQAREAQGVMRCPFQGKDIAMILGYADVRAAAKDTATYSSDAAFRVPIPSEEDVRSVRQLPIETDPPEHGELRRIVDPFFTRPRTKEMAGQIQALLERSIAQALQQGEVDAVRGFALPLQSRALTYLLNVDEAEAEEWIGWGTHVFRDGEDGAEKGSVLEDYLNRRFDQALSEQGDDFFSALTLAEFRGQPLTREQMLGFANLAFAGGRDTIINCVTEILAYFGEHPEDLQRIRENPKLVRTASEEFVRVISPLTLIGRVCPEKTNFHGVEVQPDQRIALTWASANHDAEVFECPDELRLDRKPNPHIAYGTGPHNCHGVHHARLLIRTLLKVLAEKVERVELIEASPHIEEEAEYRRRVGYDTLRIRLAAV
ncbi:MAG: cytochrome P450 [Phycisphaeraceae bacterium]|nr:cytochrome P450 [Phycisphaeraceae bacterium]